MLLTVCFYDFIGIDLLTYTKTNQPYISDSYTFKVQQRYKLLKLQTMKNEKKTLASAIRDNSLYDLSPVTELLACFATPKECSQILRDIHHNYSSLLLEDFMESDILVNGKEVQYSNGTMTELFFLKILADNFDKVVPAHA